MKPKFESWTILLLFTLGYLVIKKAPSIPNLTPLSESFLISVAIVVLSLIAIIGIIKRKMWGPAFAIILAVLNIGKMAWGILSLFIIQNQASVDISAYISVSGFIGDAFKVNIWYWIILALAICDLVFLKKQKK